MKMKKTVTSLIALALTASMGTTAFAETITEKDGSKEAPIKASYKATTPTPDTVISVDVAWGSMEFTYDSKGTKVWNPDSHKFEIKAGTPEWTCETDANKIAITNHSNAAVNASLTYEKAAGYEINGRFNESNLSLAAAVEDSAQDAAPKADALLTVSGDLAESVTPKTVIGSVKVTITAAASTN